jgi:hypothetical protein
MDLIRSHSGVVAKMLTNAVGVGTTARRFGNPLARGESAFRQYGFRMRS